MTSRPRSINLDRSLLPGLIAVALFAIMALTFLSANDTGPLESAFEAEGLSGVNVVFGIGYALIGEAAAAGAEAVYGATESFLVALILIAVLLDAALDGALMLAKRDEGGDQ